jgi:hypothetical protein
LPLILIGVTGMIGGSPSGYRRERFLPRWYHPGGFWLLNLCLLMVLFLLVARETPMERQRAFLREWYFTGTIWLLALSMIAGRYAEEKRKEKEKAAASEAGKPGLNVLGREG